MKKSLNMPVLFKKMVLAQHSCRVRLGWKKAHDECTQGEKSIKDMI
jgi:hypothetical protein